MTGSLRVVHALPGLFPRPGVALVVGLVLAASPALGQRVVQDRDYDCKVIARSNEFPSGLLVPPFQNAQGDVAFRVSVPDGLYFEEQIRVGRGDALASGVPVTRAILRAGGDPATSINTFDGLSSDAIIDNRGRVVFVATAPPSGSRSGIYFTSTAGGAGSAIPLYSDDDIDPFSPFLGFSSPMPSATGGVLFDGAAVVDGGIYVDNIFLAPVFNNSPGGFSIFPPALIAEHSLDTAWIGQEFNSLRQAVFVNQVAMDESVEVSGEWMGNFGGLSVNRNALSFVAYSRDGIPPDLEWKLVLTSIIGRDVLVDASVDPFDPFSPPIQTSVNVWGEVAFVAQPVPGARSILLADGGPVVHRMRCPQHDALLTDYQISVRALNSDGQIAFWARYLDPQTSVSERYLMRADPQPGQGARPISCQGLADGTPCDDGDPETISSCLAAVCMGDPLGHPTSCTGLLDGAICDDQDPGTYSFCQTETCMSIPVPEPGAGALAWATCLTLAALASRQRRSPPQSVQLDAP